MAKKQTEALEQVKPGALEEMPDFIDAGDVSGKENISKDDMQMPRLALAQKMSHEVDKDDDKYIEGLEVGDFFNSVTGEIFGPGPLKFVVLRTDRPRYVEFIPLKEGGGIRDFNVPANDPRTKWDGDKKPIATKFYDFIIMFVPDNFQVDMNLPPKIIALSFKSTGIKTAKKLNTLLKERPGPLYAGVYKIWSGDDENQHGKFKIYKVDNAGWPSKDEFGQQFLKFAQLCADGLKDKDVNIHRDQTEGGPADDDDM